MTVELSKLAKTIEKQLNAIEGCSVSAIEEASEEGCAYAFTMEDAAGFVSCETNEDDLGMPTVTVAVFVSELEGAETEDLLNLLMINGLFYDTAFVAHETDEETYDLFAQRRIPAEAFEGIEIEDVLADITDQLAMVMGGDEDEDAE